MTTLKDEYNQENPEKPWRQDQPNQQACAILGGLLGDLSMLEDGCPMTPERLARMLDCAQQLQKLSKSYMLRDWEDELPPER